MNVLSFGEIIWDVYPDAQYIGGAPFNFAAHARRAGANAFIMSAVGADALGAEALEKVALYGMSTEYVSTLEEHPTGVCRVTLDQNKIPTYAIAETSAYDFIPMPAKPLQGFDALAFGTLALRREHNRAVIDGLLKQCAFRQVFVDLNIRAPFDRSESIRFALERVSIVKISDEEISTAIARLGGTCEGIEESVAFLKRHFQNLHTVLVTCGGEPSILYDLRGEKTYTCPSKKTEVVSTVGAGDCYGAFFLVRYLAGEAIEVCMERAADAAFVVAHAEAIPLSEA